MTQHSFKTPKTTESLSFVSCEEQHQSLSHAHTDRPFDHSPLDWLNNFYPDHHPHHLWGGIMDALQYGILILTPDYQLLYANSKAQELCQFLSSPNEEQPSLSPLIREICEHLGDRRPQRLDEATDLNTASLVLECVGQNQQTIRAKIYHLQPYTEDNVRNNGEELIFVLLENCDEKFQAELSIECKKYGLTERETEVWKLLRQGHTYQEVAHILQLSLNTIKTHAKKIYTKQHHYQKKKNTFWFSR